MYNIKIVYTCIEKINSYFVLEVKLKSINEVVPGMLLHIILSSVSVLTGVLLGYYKEGMAGNG